MKILNFFQTHRPLTFAILIVLIILVASGLFFATRKSATLEILVAPTSARIVINDKDYQNGTYKFEPGNMVATISKAGFTTKTVNFVLNEHQVTKLYVYLLEEGGGYDWYLEHAEDAKILSKIGDTEADYKSEQYRKKYPVSTVLPIVYANYDKEWNYTEYRIDGGQFDGCKTDFCIKITDVTGGNYENAIEQIENKGYSLDDYQILYEQKPITPLKQLCYNNII